MKVDPGGYVLVIDDQRGLRLLLTELFRLMDVEVRAVANGEEGLAVARESPPCLILVDMKMPGMDGLDTIRAIRKADISTPCCLMTALGEKGTRVQEALQIAGVKLLEKPFDISTVRNLVGQLLSKGTRVPTLSTGETLSNPSSDVFTAGPLP